MRNQCVEAVICLDQISALNTFFNLKTSNWEELATREYENNKKKNEGTKRVEPSKIENTTRIHLIEFFQPFA